MEEKKKLREGGKLKGWAKIDSLRMDRLRGFRTKREGGGEGVCLKTPKGGRKPAKQRRRGEVVTMQGIKTASAEFEPRELALTKKKIPRLEERKRGFLD